MARFSRVALPDIAAIEARLDREEAQGRDGSSLRLVLRELRWRLEYTADVSAAAAALAHLRSLAGLPILPAGPARDAPGSWGAATDVWFLKLDDVVDHWLVFDRGGRRRPAAPARPDQRSRPPLGIPRRPSRLAPGRGRDRSTQGAELCYRRSRSADLAPPAERLSLAPAARTRNPPLCRRLAGSAEPASSAPIMRSAQRDTVPPI